MAAKDQRRIVCVSGGTGIAPFMSFARHLHDLGDKREIINAYMVLVMLMN